MSTTATEEESWPRISVITPSFNQVNFIEATIASVRSQTYPNFEHIIIDGGSTDGTAEVIRKHSGRLAYWVSEADAGQADAINKGMRRATGDIFCWLNSDDMFLPGALSQVAAAFRSAGKERSLVYGCTLTFCDDAGNLWAGSQTARSYDKELLRRQYYLSQPATFWRRELWERTGELDVGLHYALDWDWFIRASEHTDFFYVDQFFALYRYHASHKSSTGAGKRRDEIVRLMEKHSDAVTRRTYRQLNTHLDAIARRLGFFRRLRLPRPLFLSLLCDPVLLFSLRRYDRVNGAWTMLGG